MVLPKGFVIIVVILTFGSSCLAENVKSDKLFKCSLGCNVQPGLMYPIYPEDFQSEITNSVSQLHKNLDFEFPFYGFRYNYTRLSINGYLEFTDPPEHYTYPLKFPRNYPEEKDPAFIGPFYSKMRIGTPEGETKNGVHFRMESHLDKRNDQVAIETKDRVQGDICDGDVLGGRSFVPRHVIVATWWRMSFGGGIESSRKITNTFQLVIATDESATYAMFNYEDINWTTHTEAGGDTTMGEGGIPAFVGFNAGQGTRAFEYHPFSQRSAIRDLNKKGCANGESGRHVFRIDGKIIPGDCSNDMDYVCHLYMDQN